MTPRTLPEWIGKTPDASIPPRVRVRVWQRYNGSCQGCLRKITPGEKWDVDHIVALVNGGEHRETNMRVLCDWCHKQKTAADVAEKARTYRKRKSNLGVKKPRTITRWRKFNGTAVYASRER